MISIGHIYLFTKNFLDSVIGTLQFSAHSFKERLKYGNYRFSYNSSKNQGNQETIYILSNGPSLNTELNELLACEKFTNAKLFAPNFFAESDLFVQLKPCYYCLADPAFFSVEIPEKTKDLFVLINTKVNWPMKLFIPNWGEQYIKDYFTNKYIELIKISPLQYSGFKRFKFWSFKKGLAAPSFVNVVIMMEYVMLNLGYKKIFLCGVDHTHFANLAINDDNQLCIRQDHFYGEGNLKVMGPRYNGQTWRMKDIVYNTYLTFLEHDVMRGYADYLDATIINYTKVSWIDSYVRQAQLNKEKDIKQ